jgi:hypothetical protein
MPTVCEHTQIKVIARRDGVDYVECLVCHEIFEAEDLEPVPAEEEEDEQPRRFKVNR